MRAVQLAVGACLAAVGAPASAADRWVDDRAILEGGRFAFVTGFGVARFAPASNPAAPAVYGSGVSLEESVGLGHALELGLRFGARFDDAGRGLHADEVARALDASTFDPGTAVVAHPELRLRVGVLSRSWLDSGLEARFVLPLFPEPSVAALLGPWASIHFAEIGRADVGMAGILSRDALEARAVLVPGFVLPANVWLNVTQHFFAGVLGSVRYLAPTSLTEREARVTLGVAFGYRLLGCDALATGAAVGLDGKLTERLGLGIALRCLTAETSSDPK